jgi:hypothetical protein
MTCAVAGCDRPVHLRGFCSAHYKRWLRHGDPLAGRTGWGVVAKWVAEVAIPFGGDECLVFPFSRDDYGYGKMRRDGGNIGVHVVVCEARNGPKPSPRHEACHSCGNGHLGCVNPSHLYWGTRRDNVGDAIAHGTAHRFAPISGASAPAAKYSDEQVSKVRELLADGTAQTRIAKITGVSQSHISRIKNGARA